MDRPGVDDHTWTLGTFDEETCRFFLREVGERVVPFYPFSVGIEEVYAILLERYGRCQVADVLSVLQELLEDKYNATGVGDDGDIWRSWRHSWRHRNDGLLTSLTAKVGNFVLPPPTPRFIRSLKAENFIKLATRLMAEGLPPTRHSDAPSVHDSPASLSTTQSGLSIITQSKQSHAADASRKPVEYQELQDVIDKQEPLPEQTQDKQGAWHTSLGGPAPGRRDVAVGHQKISTNASTAPPAASTSTGNSIECDGDSQQDFVEITMPESLSNFDASLCLSFEMMKPRSSRRTSALYESANVCVLQPVQENASLEFIGTELPSENCPKSDDTTENVVMHLAADLTEDQYVQATAQPPESMADSACSQVDSNSRCTTAEGHLHEELGRKRTVHRQARLIDGAIFTSRSRRKSKKATGSPLKDSLLESSPSPRSSPVRLSWAGSARQNQPPRQSWLSGVRSLFRYENQNKQKVHDGLLVSTDKNSSNADHPRMSKSHRRLASGSSVTSSVRPVNYGLGFDSAFDDDYSPPKSPVRWDKPLPPPPDQGPSSRSASAHTKTPSFTYSQDTTPFPSTASTLSSRVSESSSRRAFEGITRELLKTDMSGGQPGELSPVGEKLLFLDPAKYDPAAGKQPRTPMSYSSLANANPFRDENVPVTPRVPERYAFQKAADAGNGYEAQGLTHSQSESSLHQTIPRHPQPAQYYVPEHLKSVPRRKPVNEMNNDRSDFGHRPSENRAETAQSDLQDVNDHLVFNKRKGSTKQPRSPIKKFFGFGKSASLNHIPSEPQSRSRVIAASPSHVSGGKSWTNKIRHGFLTSDIDDRISGPENIEIQQSPPKSSTPTISLDPPYQAKIHCELELMLVITANRYLTREVEEGRISAASLAKLREAWTRMNRPQVLDYQYDQGTQRDLIMENLKTVKLHGECAENAMVLNAAMYGWKTLAKEMGVRTFCSPDSVIRKWLHDAHKIFEMLGAPLATFLTFQELQIKTLARMTEQQRRGIERREGHRRKESQQDDECGDDSRAGSLASRHQPSAAKTPLSNTRMRKVTGAEGAIHGSPTPNDRGSPAARDAYENSRGGRLGMMVRGAAK